MKERPILFSAPMVRAILEGRKTQTRRVVRKQFAADAEPAEVAATSPEGWQISGHSGLWWDDAGACIDDAIKCPFGIPGDRLWVRENFRHFQTIWRGILPDVHGHKIKYLADDAEIEHERPAGDFSGLPKFVDESYWDRHCIPSIHMPRWASRLLLDVVGVRVERLNDISDEDAIAEGMAWDDAVYDYSRLWEQINGAGSWALNPWVWCITFRRIV